MRISILTLGLLISLISCQKTENEEPTNKIEPFLFVKLDASAPVFEIPNVISYRDLSLPSKPLVTSNKITLNNTGVYPIMARNNKNDSTLVKIFVSNDPDKFKVLTDGGTYVILTRHTDAMRNKIPMWVFEFLG